MQLTPPSDPRQGFAIPPLPEPEGSTLRAHLKQVGVADTFWLWPKNDLIQYWIENIQNTLRAHLKQVGKSQPEFQAKTHFSLYLLYGASWIVQYFVFCFGIHSSLRDNVFSAVQSGVWKQFREFLDLANANLDCYGILSKVVYTLPHLDPIRTQSSYSKDSLWQYTRTMK